jgi:hypothetical protein
MTVAPQIMGSYRFLGELSETKTSSLLNDMKPDKNNMNIIIRLYSTFHLVQGPKAKSNS